MTRPTYDDLREENSPGTLERERLERAAPEMRDVLAETLSYFGSHFESWNDAQCEIVNKIRNVLEKAY